MGDWLESIEENKESLLLLSSFLIVYFTYKTASIAKKRMKETGPTIIWIEKFTDNTKLVLGNKPNIIKILLANNKPYGITIQDVTVKQYILKKLPIKKIKSEWKPETTNKPTNIGILQWFPKFMVAPGDVGEIYLTFKERTQRSQYKICVKTTGGSCKYTLKLPLK